MVQLPHVWREGGKPANKEEKRSDADLRKNGRTFLALAEPRAHLGQCHLVEKDCEIVAGVQAVATCLLLPS